MHCKRGGKDTAPTKDNSKKGNRNEQQTISDLKELHNQVAEAVAKVTAADEKIKTEELFKALQ